jgi:hypothetical protein
MAKSLVVCAILSALGSSAQSFTKTSNNQYCPPGTELKTEADCRAAAAGLSLPFAAAFHGPDDFKHCLFADDSRKTVLQLRW